MKLKLRYKIPTVLAILTMILTALMSPAYSTGQLYMQDINGKVVHEEVMYDKPIIINAPSQILISAFINGVIVWITSYFIISLIIIVINLFKKYGTHVCE